MSQKDYVERSVLEGPNGEFIFNMVEDTTSYDKTNNIIRSETDGYSEDRTRRMNLSVPPRFYWWWAREQGSEECWLDPQFIKYIIKKHPEYATCNGKV